MVQFANGSAGAFDDLYARYKDAVYRYCLRQLPRALAEEAHQEIWLALINGREQFEARGQFKGWLFTLAHNVVRNRTRAEMKHPPAADDEPPQDQIDPGVLTEKGRLAAVLLQLIAALPQHQRDALLLQQEGGFSVAEIAEITATSPEGVKSRLRYAMSKLREQMAGLTAVESKR